MAAPTVTVSISLGGSAVRSMTYSLSSGTDFHAPPSWTWTTELATRPNLPSGVICRLVGGPSREFAIGRLARILGLAGLEMSMTSTASLPGAPKIRPSGPMVIHADGRLGGAERASGRRTGPNRE